MDFIEIKQRNVTIYKKDILEILNFRESDIVFLSGSLIEGNINKLSEGMGNELSDIDVFILSDNINRISKSESDYDRQYLKTQFKRLYGINIDIEVYSKQVIFDLMEQLNKYNFSDNIRTFNSLNLPIGFNFSDFTSFIHRFLNGIPLYNDQLFYATKDTFNQENYYRLMQRISVNEIDISYEDVVGNFNAGQYEVAVITARNILLETIKAYIFHMKTSVDRDKWIPLKIKNLARYDKESKEIYEKFKHLYFQVRLDNNKSLRKNAESIIDFSNEIINKIGQEGEL